jgi:hypothetical protein
LIANCFSGESDLMMTSRSLGVKCREITFDKGW